MATYNEWINHFNNDLSPDRVNEIREALTTLMDDELFMKEYGRDLRLLYSLSSPIE